MAELKPCPFCGKDRLYVHQDSAEEFIILCLKCGTTGPISPTEQQAIDAWNKRS